MVQHFPECLPPETAYFKLNNILFFSSLLKCQYQLLSNNFGVYWIVKTQYSIPSGDFFFVCAFWWTHMSGKPLRDHSESGKTQWTMLVMCKITASIGWTSSQTAVSCQLFSFLSQLTSHHTRTHCKKNTGNGQPQMVKNSPIVQASWPSD